MYSSINIGGFAIGVAACLLIAMFIKDELSYDKHYPNHKQMFRLVGVISQNGEEKRGVALPAPAANALKNDFPDILEAGRYNNSELFGAGSNEIRPADLEDNTFEEGFVYFDQALVDMFQFKIHLRESSKSIASAKCHCDYQA